MVDQDVDLKLLTNMLTAARKRIRDLKAENDRLKGLINRLRGRYGENGYLHWMDEDVETLVNMKKEGFRLAEIAVALGRTERSVGNKWHLVRHGFRSGRDMYEKG